MRTGAAEPLVDGAASWRSSDEQPRQRLADRRAKIESGTSDNEGQ